VLTEVGMVTEARDSPARAAETDLRRRNEPTLAKLTDMSQPSQGVQKQEATGLRSGRKVTIVG
jgi:hypothetical protein